VSRANARVLLGVVTLPDILKAYGVRDAADARLSENGAASDE
jgi:hypothetical protein